MLILVCYIPSRYHYVIYSNIVSYYVILIISFGNTILRTEILVKLNQLNTMQLVLYYLIITLNINYK